MADLLLELFSEEIPARMQVMAEAQLLEIVQAALKETRLEGKEYQSFVTPRRIAVLAKDIPSEQPAQEEERRGPKTSAPDQAIEGFCRSVGLKKDQLEIRGEGDKAAYFAVQKLPAKPASEALAPLLQTGLEKFSWPKSMRWGAHDLSWVRPLQRIICIIDSNIVPISLGHVKADRVTEGHRFLHGTKPISIKSPADYEKALEKAHVLASRKTRQTKIHQAAQQLAGELNLELRDDPALLAEVAGLVEYPVVLVGTIQDQFMSLPQEILISVMRAHQKYMVMQNDDGSLANKFLIVANIDPDDGGARIIDGNERVLRARLADGEFYWNQDRAKPLSDWSHQLNGMVFHAKLGSMADKVKRIRELASFIAIHVPEANLIEVDRAALLCKADLVTGMVGEFPELQGIMGRYYALAQEEPAAIADAIRDHYGPLGPKSLSPKAPVSVAIALSDKLDSMAGLFAAGDKPTGSKDPYALRRAALGVIRLILENALNLPLRIAFDTALKKYPSKLLKSQDSKRLEVAEELVYFTRERFRVMLRSDGIPHDHIAAIFSDPKQDDLLTLGRRITELGRFLNTEAGSNLITTYKRGANILAAEQKKTGEDFNGNVSSNLLTEAEEKTLYNMWRDADKSIGSHLKKTRYAEALGELAALRPAMDAFFDKVTVNAEDSALRANRLQLLAAITETAERVADLSQLEG